MAVATLVVPIVTLLTDLDLYDPIAAIGGKPAVRLAPAVPTRIILPAAIALLPGLRLNNGVTAPCTQPTADAAFPVAAVVDSVITFFAGIQHPVATTRRNGLGLPTADCTAPVAVDPVAIVTFFDRKGGLDDPIAAVTGNHQPRFGAHQSLVVALVQRAHHHGRNYLAARRAAVIAISVAVVTFFIRVQSTVSTIRHAAHRGRPAAAGRETTFACSGAAKLAFLTWVHDAVAAEISADGSTRAVHGPGVSEIPAGRSRVWALDFTVPGKGSITRFDCVCGIRQACVDLERLRRLQTRPATGVKRRGARGESERPEPTSCASS